MNEIRTGLFEHPENMPCAPMSIAVRKYSLLSTLGNAEAEEAAARIIYLSQQLNQWVGVTWPHLSDIMLKEYEEYQSFRKARNHNTNELRRVDGEMKRYSVYSFLTFGISRSFMLKPEACLHEVPNVDIPSSGIFFFGPDYVVDGIHHLLESGFLQKVTRNDEHSENFDVLFPTPELVSHIMKIQDVTL